MDESETPDEGATTAGPPPFRPAHPDLALAAEIRQARPGQNVSDHDRGFRACTVPVDEGTGSKPAVLLPVTVANALACELAQWREQRHASIQ